VNPNFVGPKSKAPVDIQEVPMWQENDNIFLEEKEVNIITLGI